MNAEMMKCYMMRIYEVKPDCRDLWKKSFAQCKAMWERHGAMCMGQWQVCLGGSCTFMMIMEFPNTAAALKCQMEIRMDPEHAHMISMCYKCVDKITCPLLKCCPITPQVTKPDMKSNLVVLRFTTKGTPCMVMKETKMFMEKFMERFCTPCGMKMVGCFCPSYTLTCNCIYVMLEMPESNTVSCLTKMDEFAMAMCMDAGYCESMKPFFDCIGGYSMKMMNCC